MLSKARAITAGKMCDKIRRKTLLLGKDNLKTNLTRVGRTAQRTTTDALAERGPRCNSQYLYVSSQASVTSVSEESDALVEHYIQVAYIYTCWQIYIYIYIYKLPS